MTFSLIFRNLQIHSINASKKSLIPKYPLNKLKILKYANIAILQQSVRDRKKSQKRQNSEVNTSLFYYLKYISPKNSGL